MPQPPTVEANGIKLTEKTAAVLLYCSRNPDKLVPDLARTNIKALEAISFVSFDRGVVHVLSAGHNWAAAFRRKHPNKKMPVTWSRYE